MGPEREPQRDRRPRAEAGGTAAGDVGEPVARQTASNGSTPSNASNAPSPPTAPIRVLHTLPNFDMGGGQMVVCGNIAHADRTRFAHEVWSVWHDEAPAIAADLERAGARVGSLRLRRSLVPLALWRLVRAVRAGGARLLHTNNTPWEVRLAAAASRLTGVPVVNTLHSMAFTWTAGAMARLERRALAGSLRCAVAVSAAVRRAWLPYTRQLRLADERVVVIRPGVDAARFTGELAPERRAALRRELQLEGRGPLLLMVARLAPGKGHEHLPAVLGRVRQRWPEAVALLAGDGPLRAAIERRCTEAGLAAHCRFLGTRSDVPDLLALADVALAPSVGEGFGLGVLEAMAAATPVAAFELEVLREFFTPGEHGALVPQGDAEAFAAAVASLLADPARRAAMGAAARAAVLARHTLAQSVRQLEELYLEVLGAGPAG
jgi:glycosyltransferase involved in cell wall biosynthesis